MTNSLYEQLKDDLGYLGLARSAECFATLAEEAKAAGVEPHRVPGPGHRRAGDVDAQPQAGGPAALRPLPVPAESRATSTSSSSPASTAS